MREHPVRDALSDLAARATSARTGCFYEITEIRVSSDFDFLFATTAEVCNVGQRKVVTAAGGAFTRARARQSAIGEAIERLGLCTYADEKVTWASFDELAGRALDPRSCLHYDADVYRRPALEIAPYAPSVRGAWYEARNLTTGHAEHVPAVFVYNQIPENFPAAARWDRPLSTGAACSLDEDRAILTGLYEAIERDALIIHWENRIPGIRRPPPERAHGALAAIGTRGFDVEIVELSSDLGATVALAAVLDRSGRRAALGVGTAARATWADAAYRALEEAILCMMWITGRREWKPSGLEALGAELSGVPDPVLHAEFYGHASMAPRCGFLFRDTTPSAPPATAPPITPSEAPSDELRALRARVEAAGMQVLVADITPPEAAPLGFHVVRVLVPGLVPLSRGFHARPLASERLRRAAPGGRFVGNPDPHPLP